MLAKKIEFSYGKQEFIHDTSIGIERGKITTILGPNGSGKSTMLNLFTRQLEPNKGNITFSEVPITEMKQKEFAKKIAVVHQHNTAPQDLLVKDLVAYGRVPHQSFFNPDQAMDDEIVAWAMDATNITYLAEKPIAELSGGERQRAWIAMSLAQKTDFLFLDEPTTYLDISYQMEVLDLVKKLNRENGITIVMVLHDINQAIQYSDSVVIMKAGKMIFHGDVKAAITEERIFDVYGIHSVIKTCPVNHCPYIIPIQFQKENRA